MSVWEGIRFTQSQKKGMALLLLLIGGLSCGIWAWKKWVNPDVDWAAIPFLQTEKDRTPPKAPLILEINLADSSEWAALPGIGPVLSQRIIRYRNSIGGFHTIDQVHKVYGLKPETWQNIQPFLRLDPAHIPQARKRESYTSKYPPSPPPQIIEINRAGEAEWKLLPGIGEVLSKRIVKYRDAIGGFGEISELTKVYGLKPEVFAEISPWLTLDSLPPVEEPAPIAARNPTSGTPRGEEAIPFPAPAMARRIAIAPVNINQADSAQLVSLPGIGARLAPRILSYRRLLGHFVSLDQLTNVYGMSEENLQRMSPHLFIDETEAFPRKDINQISARELAYLGPIDKTLANQFVAYRRKLGRFSSWSEVAEMKGMNEEIYQLLRAYYQI